MTINYDRYSNNLVEIDDKFYNFSKSENGIFLVAWRDSDEELDTGFGGCRKKGHGRIMLIKDNYKIYDSLFCERPIKAKVTNKGTVILLDAMFGNGRKGEIYVIDAVGNIKTKHRVRKNLNTDIFSFGITEDEKFAWFSTYLYSGYIIDLSSGEIVKKGNSILNLSGVYVNDDKKVCAIKF